MNNGFIFIHRQLLEWEWYSDTNTKVLFIHCLLMANWEEKTWRGRIIKRGQFFTSIGNLSAELSLSTKTIRTALDKLQKTSEVTSERANDGTMITVCKYDNYQDLENSKGKLKGKQKANELPNGLPSELPTTKEYKENKEEYSFIDFWNDYDKKVGLQKVKLIWNKLSIENKLKIRVHIPKYKEATPNKKYRKDPQGYLNQGKWEDEIVETSNKPPVAEARRMSLEEAQNLKNSFG